MSTSGGSSGGAVTVATTDITGAQLATIKTTPITLVAAPGANKAIAVASMAYEAKPATVGYAAGFLGPYYAGAIVAADVIESSAGLLDMFRGRLPTAQIVSVGLIVPAPIPTAGAANRALVMSNLDNDMSVTGHIVTTALNAGGSGYVVNDTGTVDNNAYGTAATYIVTSVAPVTGAVTGYTIVAAGNGYLTDTGVTTTPGGAQPGIGTGFTMNITAVTPPDGHLYVTVAYYTITTH